MRGDLQWWQTLARSADIVTENVVREATKGAMPARKRELYENTYPLILMYLTTEAAVDGMLPEIH